MKSAVVIAFYNDFHCLKLVLQGWNRQPLHKFRLVLVNDGGEPAPRSVLRAFKGNMRVVRLGPKTESFRLAEARNLGIYYSKGTQYICTDADCIPCEGFIDRHQASFGNRRIVVGCTVAIAKDEVTSMGHLPSYKDLDTLSIVRDERVDSSMNLVQKLDHTRVWGGNFSIPLITAKNVRGFDPEFIGWGGEDVTLADRLISHLQFDIEWTDAFLYHLDHPTRTDTKSAHPWGLLNAPLISSSTIFD